MIKLLIKLIGFGLVMGGIYFLGQNITIHTNYGYWWGGISAKLAVLLVTGGIVALVFLKGELQKLGGILIVIGIICVFVSSRISLSPTSLWNYFLGIIALIGWGKMLSSGKIDF